MASTRNSHPKRAYRRKQKARVRRNRLRFADTHYHSAYWTRTAPDGTVYVMPSNDAMRTKRAYKAVARRRIRRARLNECADRGHYRKIYDLWWTLY